MHKYINNYKTYNHITTTNLNNNKYMNKNTHTYTHKPINQQLHKSTQTNNK